MQQKARCLCDTKQQKVCDTVYVSLFSGLSLVEYAIARQENCTKVHVTPCDTCNRFLSVIQIILEQGYCLLSNAFGIVAPGKTYSAGRARDVLLQLPLVSVRIGRPESGRSFSILMEKYPQTDYSKIGAILNGLATAFLPKEKTATLEKSMVKMLLSIAQSDRERECVRYAIYKASGMTPIAIRRAFGFENMKLRETKIEEAVYEIQKIHETIFNLAAVEDEALLMRFGIQVQADSSSDDSEEEEITPEDSDRLFDHQIVCKGILQVLQMNYPNTSQILLT